MEHLQPVPVSTQQARAEAEAAFHEYLTQSRSGDAPPLSSFLDKYNPLVRAELERLIEDYLILRSSPGLLMVAPTAGTELGGFVLERELGRGGMGQVWEAQQRLPRRQVALKLLHPHLSLSDTSLRRFENEALACRRLSHEHIVSVYAVGEDQGVHWIAMELVPGGYSLAERIAEQRLQPPPAREHWASVVRMVRTLAAALWSAHSAGVVHRDIKPHNILIGANGEPKICDFGLAMVQDNLTLSRSGKLSGTPYYMSPEQAAGSRFGIDARTDIYSLGVTLYEALVLERPYSVESQGELLERILLGDTPDPRSVRTDLPDDLAAIVMMMMAKRREHRYDNMALVVEDLDRWLRGERPHARLRSRRPWLRPLLVTASAVLVLGGSWYWASDRTPVDAATGSLQAPRMSAAEAEPYPFPLGVQELSGMPVLLAAAERLEAQIQPNTSPERRIAILLTCTELRLEGGAFAAALGTLNSMQDQALIQQATITQRLSSGELRARCAQLLGRHELERSSRQEVLQLACEALRQDDPRRQFAAVQAASLEDALGRNQAAQAAIESTFGLRSMLRSRLFRSQRTRDNLGPDVKELQAQLGELLLVEGSIESMHEGRRLLADAALAVRNEKGPKAWQSLYAQWRALRAGRLVLQMEGLLPTTEPASTQTARAQNLSSSAAGLHDSAVAVPLLQLRIEAERIYALEAAHEALALPEGLVTLRRMETAFGADHPETVELRACVVRLSLAAWDAADALELATTNQAILERHAERGAPVLLEAELYAAQARCALFGLDDPSGRAMLETLLLRAAAQMQALEAGPDSGPALHRLRYARLAEVCESLLED